MPYFIFYTFYKKIKKIKYDLFLPKSDHFETIRDIKFRLYSATQEIKKK